MTAWTKNKWTAHQVIMAVVEHTAESIQGAREIFEDEFLMKRLERAVNEILDEAYGKR